jgi:hypothetical protein
MLTSTHIKAFLTYFKAFFRKILASNLFQACFSRVKPLISHGNFAKYALTLLILLFMLFLKKFINNLAGKRR